MAIHTREPIIAYLLVHAPEQPAEHAQALEQLAAFVRGLADDDERLLMLATLAIRNGQFVPGPATEHALNQFMRASVRECNVFLSDLSRVARDDALARARERGFLPPLRPL
jgi:hypothetical protein